jgi:hypothetical protein
MSMPDAEQRDIAEALFEPKQSREEIKNAIKLEEARRAAMVKNLYRLRSLRLSRNQATTQSNDSEQGVSGSLAILAAIRRAS